MTDEPNTRPPSERPVAQTLELDAMSVLAKEPNELEEADFEISNFDGGKFSAEQERLLRAGKHWASHPAWDHWGAIWFADGKFYERVMRFSAHVATMSNETLEGLIGEVNAEFGHD